MPRRLLILLAVIATPAAAQQAAVPSVGPVPPLSGVIVPGLYGQAPPRQVAQPPRARPQRHQLVPVCVERQGIGGSQLVCPKPRFNR